MGIPAERFAVPGTFVIRRGVFSLGGVRSIRAGQVVAPGKRCLEDSLLLSIGRGEISDPALSHFLLHMGQCGPCCVRSDELIRKNPGKMLSTLAKLAPRLEKTPPPGAVPSLDKDGIDWIGLARSMRPKLQLPRLECPSRAGELPTFGPYQIEGTLGEGASSVVYKAFDPELGRSVALKVLRPDVAAREGMAETFLAEARALAKVKSPNLVTLLTYGKTPAPHLTMELLEGRSLADRLENGPIPEREALRLLLDLARGLKALHAGGLVHRDIKPANVWLSPSADQPGQEYAVLMDLGLAGNRNLVAGTPGYQAPELLGQTEPSPASDIFSLGTLLRVMALGADKGEETRGPAPAALEPLIYRMMDPRPERRPTAAEVMEQVWQWERARGATRRRLIGGLAVAAASALGVGFWYLGRDSVPLDPQAGTKTPPGLKPTRLVERAFPAQTLNSLNRFGVAQGRHAILTANYLALAAEGNKPDYVHRNPFEADNFGLFGERAVFCSADGELILVDASFDPPREVARYRIDQGAGRLDPVQGFHVSPGGKLLVFTAKSLFCAVPSEGRYPEALTPLGNPQNFANGFTPARMEWAEDENDTYAFMERGGISRVGPVFGGEKPFWRVWATRYTPNGLKVFRTRPGVPGAFCLGVPGGQLGIHGPELVPASPESAAYPVRKATFNFASGIRDVQFLDTDHLVILTAGADKPLRVANVSEVDPVWHALATPDPLAIHTEPDKATLHCLGQDGSVRVWTLPDILSQIREGNADATVAKRPG